MTGDSMSAPIYSLHNHTPFSDGAYSIDELCEAHLKLDGLRVAGIGISDHLFCTPTSRAVNSERDFEQLFATETQRYMAGVAEARQRWEGRLRVLCGCEIDWRRNRELLAPLRALVSGMDYVLFKNVDWAGVTQLANQSRRWPCPIGLSAVPVSRQFPSTSPEQVVRTLANARIFYEISTHFLPLAPSDPWFNLLPRHRVRVSFGADTHDDLSVLRDLPRLVDYAEQRGLAGRLLDFEPSLARAAAS
jgi:hypothetical protein